MTLREALLSQAGHCAALDSPFMARMLPLLAEVWSDGSPLDQTVQAYEGDIGPKGHSLPLRLASGLHALVLTKRDAGLLAAYPPNTVTDDELKGALVQALADHSDFMMDWIKVPPQTNEVRRSAVLIAGAHHLTRITGAAQVCLFELGASAGLNLMFDAYALVADDTRLGPEDAALTLTPEWNGPAPHAARFTVKERRGVDLNPLDAHNPDHALRLRSYLWADQQHRMALTDAAISANAVTVDKGDAIDWLANRLETAPNGHMHLVFHTIAWQYFPQSAQDRGTALIETAGARATSNTPLAWLRMEADTHTRGARVSARLWPGDQRIELGRVDFHGRWVDWAPDTA